METNVIILIQLCYGTQYLNGQILRDNFTQFLNHNHMNNSLNGIAY